MREIIRHRVGGVAQRTWRWCRAWCERALRPAQADPVKVGCGNNRVILSPMKTAISLPDSAVARRRSLAASIESAAASWSKRALEAPGWRERGRGRGDGAIATKVCEPGSGPDAAWTKTLARMTERIAPEGRLRSGAARSGGPRARAARFGDRITPRPVQGRSSGRPVQKQARSVTVLAA